MALQWSWTIGQFSTGSLLGELCEDSISSTLPREFKEKCEDFLKGLSTRVEIYQRNYEMVISLTVSQENHADSSHSIE